MTSVRLPAIATTALAPVSLIGGWWLEAQAAPGYDAVRQTISELAARDMPTYFAMNLVFVLTGLCHLVTAGFTPGLPPAARGSLAAAGLAMAALALVPLASASAIDWRHRVVGMSALLLPGVWPLVAARWPAGLQLPRRLLVGLGTSHVVITIWFFIIWNDRAGLTGFAERCSAALGVLIPTIVVHRLWWMSLQPATTRGTLTV